MSDLSTLPPCLLYIHSRSFFSLFHRPRARKRQIHPGEGRRLAQVLQGLLEREGGEGEGERGGRREIERSAKVVERRRQVSRGEKKFARQVSGGGTRRRDESRSGISFVI